MTESDMELPSRVSTIEDERRTSVSSSMFRTPLHKSRSGDAQSLKSSPANPHLTETNGQSTSLRVYEENADKRSTREHLSDIITQDQSSIDSQIQSGSNGTDALGAPFDDTKINGNGKTDLEPEILAHRREHSGTITVSKLRTKNDSSLGSPSIPISELDSYDPKLYTNEFYADTRYRFASDKRNNDFHQLFPKVPESEKLLDAFSCALSREFLIQGRIYVTPMRICFNSNLLGWVTSLEVYIKDVVTLEKTSTAGLFPNGICIHLATEKHYFASFLSRDTTFKFLEIIWHTRKELDYLTIKPEQLSLNRTYSLNDFLTGTRNTCPPSRASFTESDSAIESAIMSVDDSLPVNKSLSNLNEELDSDSESLDDDLSDDEDQHQDNDDADESVVLNGDGYYYDEEAIASDSEGKSVRKVFKLKKSSKFTYNGPYYFKSTDFIYNPEENEETVLAELELAAPPGLIYQLMFSEENPEFILSFLKAQKSSQFSVIPPFDQVNPEGQRYREYSYAKALNYPVGPKSTKCIVSEHILYCAYDDYINVVNTTQTPDVPSGNSFSVKTRYMYRWKDNTSCVLKVSYWVDWTGSSWIKSMVDSSVNSGQLEATEKLKETINEFMNSNVEEVEMKVSIQPKKSLSSSRRVSKISRKASKLTIKEKTPPALEKEVQIALTKENIIICLLFIIALISLFNTLCQVRVIRKLNKLMNTNSVSVIEELKDILSVYNELPMSREDRR